MSDSQDKLKGSTNLIALFLYKVFADNQHIHLGAREALNRFPRFADDRFVFVERGAEHNRNSLDLLKFAG